MVCHPKHIFHQKCIDQWLSRKSNCPICKNRVRADNDSRDQRFLIENSRMPEFVNHEEIYFPNYEEIDFPNHENIRIPSTIQMFNVIDNDDVLNTTFMIHIIDN